MERNGAKTDLTRLRQFLPVTVMLCAVMVLGGCRSSGSIFGRRSDPESGGVASRGDPLLGGARIPPQNLPVPGREGYGSRDRRDPLLGSPASREESGERAGKNSPKGSALRQPTKDNPFRPGPETTNAALASHLVPDDTLSIGDRRPTGQTASRPRDDSPDLGRYSDELRRLGVTLGEPERVGNGYEVHASVPLGDAGRRRQYTGAGPTASAAVKQVLDQIKNDGK